MDNLNKVTYIQIYHLWRNIAVSMAAILAVILSNKLLPTFFTPIVSILSIIVLQALIYFDRKSKNASCMIIPYATLIGMSIFTFVSLLFFLLHASDIIHINKELLFSNRPFVPILILAPIFLITLVLYINQPKLNFCIDCKLQYGDKYERGRWGETLKTESHHQLKNITLIFTVLTITSWLYYLTTYVNININDRDNYVFVWTAVILFAVDLAYYFVRYYNLYLDMKENKEIILPHDIDGNDNTYVRFYVICGNKIFINKFSNRNSLQEEYDTPFFMKYEFETITINSALNCIKKMTGIEDGELRFFYGRITPKPAHNKILRYFYFVKSCDQINTTSGEWIDYNEIKQIYTSFPSKLSKILVADTTRLATIIITEKKYYSNGYRKVKLGSYQPPFNLTDVYESHLDFQDDKWINVSLFNADVKFFRLRKFLRNLLRKRHNNNIHANK